MTPRRRRGDPLTPQQRHLMRLLADTDMSMQLIGHRLGITANAAQHRATALYAELGVANRAGLRQMLLECELAGAA